MEKEKIIDILRNPYGWDDKSRRKARLAVADILEKESKKRLKSLKLPLVTVLRAYKYTLWE